MAQRFRLKNVGSPVFKKIMLGNETVGRVCRTATEGYYAFIGPVHCRAMTEDAAFTGVCDKYGKPELPLQRERSSIGPAPKPEPMRELDITAVFVPPEREPE